MTNIARPYNVVLFGATGYTGSLTAEYFAKAFPKHLNWAIAGRSASKLELVARKCRDISHGTQYPGEKVDELFSVIYLLRISSNSGLRA